MSVIRSCSKRKRIQVICTLFHLILYLHVFKTLSILLTRGLDREHSDPSSPFPRPQFALLDTTHRPCRGPRAPPQQSLRPHLPFWHTDRAPNFPSRYHVTQKHFCHFFKTHNRTRGGSRRSKENHSKRLCAVVSSATRSHTTQRARACQARRMLTKDS